MPASFAIALANLRRHLIDQPLPEVESVCAVRIKADALEGTAVPSKIAMQVTIRSACVMLQLLYKLWPHAAAYAFWKQAGHQPLLHSCQPCVHACLPQCSASARYVSELLASDHTCKLY